MENCIFCKIAKGEIKGDVVFQNDNVVAFRDLNPQAPVHILVIPTKHITTLNDLTPAHNDLVSELIRTATKLASDEGIAEKGYRLVWNCNAEGGQSVYHIHLHLLGGRPMAWPPG